eukprot:304270_1
MRAFCELPRRFISSNLYVSLSAVGFVTGTSWSYKETKRNNSSPCINHYFKHKLGRVFPNFDGKQEPNWRSIKYNEPHTIMDKHESLSRYMEPKTPPTNEFILNTLCFLRDNIEWRQRDEYHDVSWYVENGCECDYEYDANDPQPHHIMPSWMLNFRDAMCFALDIDDPPNACNINWYRDGNAGIGRHADDEELFEGLHKKIQIISMSIGAEREFEIYETTLETAQEGDDNAPCAFVKSILLKNMSYLTMEGLFQKHFKHAVPKYDKEDINSNMLRRMHMNEKEEQQTIEELIQNVGPRINLTWRWITKHNKDCPLS